MLRLVGGACALLRVRSSAEAMAQLVIEDADDWKLVTLLVDTPRATEKAPEAPQVKSVAEEELPDWLREALRSDGPPKLRRRKKARATDK